MKVNQRKLRCSATLQVCFRTGDESTLGLWQNSCFYREKLSIRYEVGCCYILLDDSMPNPNQTLQNNYAQFSSPSTIRRAMPSSSYASENTTHPSAPSRKNLSYPQLFAIYSEIVNEWCKQQWLLFVDDHAETFLTLDVNTNRSLTVQTAIDRHHLTTGKTFLRSPPECLLIRTEPNTDTLFVPNLIISLENLYDNGTGHRLARYKLMAMICHSKKTNSKLMLYKASQLDSWFVYYDQSILSHSRSNRLSDEEKEQLESFLEPNHRIDPSKFTSPLSALCNHPIIYVYMPEKIGERN